MALANTEPLPALLLASASPRRSELLQQIHVEFERVTVDVDEKRHPTETPSTYVERVALAKALAGRALFPGDCRPVLGADTAVVLGDQVLGKPRDKQHALAMLRQLAGRKHQVLSAVALVTNTRTLTAISRSEVSFRAISDQEALSYWQTGEPRDKAGGYAIQGRAAVFISGLTGSYSGVMGLPLFETARLLQQVKIDQPGR